MVLMRRFWWLNVLVMVLFFEFWGWWFDRLCWVFVCWVCCFWCWLVGLCCCFCGLYWWCGWMLLVDVWRLLICWIVCLLLDGFECWFWGDVCVGGLRDWWCVECFWYFWFWIDFCIGSLFVCLCLFVWVYCWSWVWFLLLCWFVWVWGLVGFVLFWVFCCRDDEVSEGGSSLDLLLCCYWGYSGSEFVKVCFWLVCWSEFCFVWDCWVDCCGWCWVYEVLRDGSGCERFYRLWVCLIVWFWWFGGFWFCFGWMVFCRVCVCCFWVFVGFIWCGVRVVMGCRLCWLWERWLVFCSLKL